MRLAVIAALVLCVPVCVGAAPYQVSTTSWPGLTGLFVIPTARLLGGGRLAVGFNESKHSEFHVGKYTDRQIRGTLTYCPADWIEIYGSHYNDMFVINGNSSADNESFNSCGLKVRVMEEDKHYWYPEVSIAVRDLFNQTRDVGVLGLTRVNNGAKVFLLASKKLFRNDAVGRFMDVHAGLTWDQAEMSGVTGLELTLAPNVSLIAEGMWDSSYLNFSRYGQNDVPGRFIMDTGLRIYPELVPGLALDMGFVGDSEFEFSFAASYVFGL